MMKNKNNIKREYSALLSKLEDKGFKFGQGLSIEEKLENFEIALDKEYKRSHGVVYTPEYIAQAMIDDSFELWGLDKDISDWNNIKIIDPCCGAGIFTIKILEKLVSILNNKNIYDIIKDNIYFCDLDENAVEITKHRLWSYVSEEVPEFKDFVCNGYYADFIDGNYKGYSTYLGPHYKVDGGFDLIDIHEDYQELCLKNGRDKNFANAMLNIQGATYKIRNTVLDVGVYLRKELLNGGFDIVIGNPPYVSTKDYKEDKEFLSKRYLDIFCGGMDLCLFFFRRAWDMLNKNGIVSMITTNTWMTSDSSTKFREWLHEDKKLNGLFDFVRTMPFKDAGVTVAISVLSKQDNSKVRYNDVADADDKLRDYIKNSKMYNVENIYTNGVVEFLNSLDIDIQEKFNRAKRCYNKIEDYCDGFRTGLLTGNLKIYTNIDLPGSEFLTDELREKYPNLIRKAYKPYRNTGRNYWNLLYIRSGDYKSIDELPEEIQEYLLEYKWNFENRDSTTIGEEWYSLKHGVTRVDKGATHGMISAYKKIVVNAIDSDSIVLDGTTIFTNIKKDNLWVVDYLNNELVEALYNKCVKCLMYPNSSVPRKQSKEINEFPVVCKENDIESIRNGFGLTENEVKYLLEWNREVTK